MYFFNVKNKPKQNKKMQEIFSQRNTRKSCSAVFWFTKLSSQNQAHDSAASHVNQTESEASFQSVTSVVNMAGAIQEGPEFGIGDFILLEHVDMPSFMKNLKKR